MEVSTLKSEGKLQSVRRACFLSIYGVDAAIISNIKETSTKLYVHHFKSDSINNMGHMRISGTETPPVIPAKQSSLNVEKWCPKMPKQGEAKRDCVNNPQNYNFN